MLNAWQPPDLSDAAELAHGAHGAHGASHGEVPFVTFPNEVDDTYSLLVNSDPYECNQNLSRYIKTVVDETTKESDNIYAKLSLYALKLLTSKMFIRNYKLCLGKLLGIVEVFTNIKLYENQTGEKKTSEADCRMQDFICITFFLLLKLKSSPEHEPEFQDFNESLDINDVLDTLKSCTFISIIANFIVCNVGSPETSFTLLKFCCDIIFEYLFHVELLSDKEFENIVSTTSLIPTLIDDLLSNNSFHDYDMDENTWEDEEKLIAYEEFKLLLLINEQYLMKSYTCRDVRNKVFDGLMTSELEPSDSVNSRISGFINLLVFHLNREESQIIKILILKFLYLIFTSSYTAKLYYLNDLKILVDIFVRDLNNIEYVDEDDKENRILVITYLKVMYPMLTFSQLNDLANGYKNDDIVNILSHFTQNKPSSPQLKLISDLAAKCMKVPWLKKRSLYSNVNSSASSLTSANNSSSESLAQSFTRVASVRASSRNDYHLSTTRHNEEPVDVAKENNHNMFAAHTKLERRLSNILDLPHEYLNHTDSPGTLHKKAMRKKAPPPPSPMRTPPPPIRRAIYSPSPNYSSPSPRPVPPPPRRRR